MTEVPYYNTRIFQIRKAYPIEGGNSVNVINAALTFVTHHGLQSLIVADSGTEFKNGIIQEFVDSHKISILYTTPDSPQFNGMIKRFHSTFIEHLRILRNTKTTLSIKEQMPYGFQGYNNSVHSSTKLKPIEVLNGHVSARDPFDIDKIRTLLNDYIEQHRNS